MMKKILLLVTLIVLLTGCTPSANDAKPAEEAKSSIPATIILKSLKQT